MTTSICITAGKVRVEAVLNDSAVAEKIARSLPITGSAQRWGEEIYFSIPVECELESGARQEVQIGELGYWPPGNAFCMFFGPTPSSQGDRIMAASEVNIVGMMSGDLSGLSGVPQGAAVRIEKK